MHKLSVFVHGKAIISLSVHIFSCFVHEGQNLSCRARHAVIRVEPGCVGVKESAGAMLSSITPMIRTKSKVTSPTSSCPGSAKPSNELTFLFRCRANLEDDRDPKVRSDGRSVLGRTGLPLRRFLNGSRHQRIQLRTDAFRDLDISDRPVREHFERNSHCSCVVAILRHRNPRVQPF